MYSKQYYAWKKMFSSVTNFIWSIIMLLVVIGVIAGVVYGIKIWWGVFGPEIQ